MVIISYVIAYTVHRTVTRTRYTSATSLAKEPYFYNLCVCVCVCVYNTRNGDETFIIVK